MCRFCFRQVLPENWRRGFLPHPLRPVGRSWSAFFRDEHFLEGFPGMVEEHF